MISAHIGDQVAAGGAGQMNARQRQYWDRWIQRGKYSGLWQFGLLIALFILIAAAPVVVDHYLANMGQPDAEAGTTTQQPSAAAPQYAQPSPQYAQPAPQTQPSGAWSQTPGYESDFGRPSNSGSN